MAERVHGATPEGRAYASYTRELHALWASCFSTPLASCRSFLKALAYRSWREVTGARGIYSEAQHGVVAETVFGTAGWILFTDDDDWFAPDVFARLEALTPPAGPACVVWKRVRFDGRVTVTPVGSGPHYAYTNNYAVRAETFAAGTPVSDVMQHGFADDMIRTERWRVLVGPDAMLSITNKTPCSWNYLDQAKRSEAPGDTLRQRLEQYVSTPLDLGEQLGWAEPYARAAREFFRTLVRR